MVKKDLLKTRFPLLKLVRVPAGVRFPGPDKFEGLTLDLKQTAAASKSWTQRLTQVARIYKPVSEREALLFHLALIEGMKKFTMPSPEEKERLQHYSVCKKLSKIWPGVVTRTAAKEEKLCGLSIQSPSHFDCEELEPGWDLEAETALDPPSVFTIHLHDPRKAETGRIADTEKVGAVVVRKFLEGEWKSKAILYGVYHAVKHAIENIDKGHGAPVYVLVMTGQTWSYAKLVPEGYVRIQDGKLDPKSLEVFTSHQKLTKNRKSNLKVLEKKLRSFERAATDRDGSAMLVGKLYVRDSWFSLPSTVETVHADTERLFHGLLRLILGDSVRKMTKEDFSERIQLNAKIDRLLNAH